MDVLRINGLYKSFGDKKVLSGLDLTVPEHSIFGFVGKNGSGKTTTMKAVLGLLKADSGEIYVDGRKVTYGQTETNRMIGYLPDVPEFYGFMNAPEYLMFCGDILGMDKKDISARTDEMLALVGLKGEKHRINGFSRGMKQRLGIAQALFGRPRLLICDEPTSALDPVGRKEILDILLAAREQTTVLFSTHILSDVERICTDVALLDGGVAKLQGKLADIKGLKNAGRYIIETEAGSDALTLKGVFGNALTLSGERIITCKEGQPLFDLLRFISDKKIPVLRVEREEMTLEDLFVEFSDKSKGGAL